jgi:hypothetical protein
MTVVYDPYSAAVKRDPYPYYRALRDVPSPFWSAPPS